MYLKDVSSAYCINFKKLLEAVISLMYIMKRSGPKIEPLRTPMVIEFLLDLHSSISTKYNLLFKYDWNQLFAVFFMPK